LSLYRPTSATQIYTLSLHDALPIYSRSLCAALGGKAQGALPHLSRHEHRGSGRVRGEQRLEWRPALCRAERDLDRNRSLCAVAADRKSTRLNSSHRTISYAVFCVKK